MELQEKYFELGDIITKLGGKVDIINIDVNVALDVGMKIEKPELRNRFFYEKYLELVQTLEEAGLFKREES